MVFPGLRSIFREGREDERRRWGVTRAVSLKPMSSLFLLFPVCPLPPFPAPAAFHTQPPNPPHSAHLFPTSVPCPYNMVFAVCPVLKFPEPEAGKLCTFHRPTSVTRRIDPFITTLVSQSVLPCLKSPFGNGVLLIIRRDVGVA